MKTAETSLTDAIEEKIAWADRCLGEEGDRIVGDATVAALLVRLSDAVRASREAMAATGVAELCARCDREEGGSCCGAGMEDRYDGRLLLINRLLDVELPERRFADGSCYFLGQSGCLLQARDVICVNYLCATVTDRIDPREIRLLREKEGEELETLFILHERIGRLIDSW